MGNGIKAYTTGLNHTFSPSNFCYSYKTGNGKRRIVVKNATGSGYTFYIWPTANSGNMAAIGGSKSGSTVTADFDANVNCKAAGEYTVHAYTGGSFAAGTKFSVDKSELVKNGWYYENYEGRPYKFYYINGVRQTDVRGIIGPQGSYIATVNRTCNTVTIFTTDGSNGYILPVCSFACSVGLPGTPTDPGVYYTSGKWRWKELMGPSWGQYATRVYPSVYFHSVAGVNTTPYNLNYIDYNNLGQAASHGCIRLCVRDAKWIYDNCALGMQVTIYDSGSPGPMGKPGTIKIPAGQTWDPTDPAV
jgi:lipoprotein-anchoring transpeptidase ErfK/SrfK